MRARPTRQQYRIIAVALLILSTSILMGCSTTATGNNSGPLADATDTPYIFIPSTLPPTVPVYYPTATTSVYYAPTPTTPVYYAPTPTTPAYNPTATPSPTTPPPPTPTATTPPPPASATVVNFAYTPSIASCYLSFDIENTSSVVASNVYYTDSISGNGVTVSGGAGVGDIAAGGSVHQSFPVNFVNFNGVYTDVSISVYEYGSGGVYIGSGAATILHC
jgi:hypothetical protein